MPRADAKQAPAPRTRHPYWWQSAEAGDRGGEASAPALNDWRVYVAPKGR